MKVLILDLAHDFKLNPDQLYAFAVEYHNRYGIFDYERGMDHAKTDTWNSDQLVKDFKKANIKGHDWREELQEMLKELLDMKKLNEDVNITDPQMAQKYAEGMARVAKHDAEIASLKSQIARIDGQKSDIQTELAKISGQAAPEASQNQQTPEQAAAAAAAAVVGQGQPTSESLLVRVNESEDEAERIQLEIDQISDQMMLMEDPVEIAEMEDYLRNLVDQLKQLDMDQMDHEDSFEPDYESDPRDLDLYDDIDLNPDYDLDQHRDFDERDYDDMNPELDEAENDEPRFTGMHGFPYEVNKEGRPIKKIDPVRSPRERKQRPWSDAKLDKYDQFDKDIRDIGYEIEGSEEEMKYNMERFQAPNYEGIEGEIEEFFSQIGFEASDVLNSGMSDKEKIKGLKKLSVKHPEDLLHNYHHYFPEYDSSLDKQRKAVEKENKQIQAKIDKLKAKIAKKEEQQDKMGYPVYDSYNPMSPENFYDLDEAYVEREGEEKKTKEDYLDNDYVFYVKVIDGDNEFIGKIFKISPDGDWYGIVKNGDDNSFEKISYEPEYDEIDIVEFLGDSYDTIEIIDQHEFNDYIEDNEDNENEKEYKKQYHDAYNDFPKDDEDIEETWPSNSIASS